MVWMEKFRKEQREIKQDIIVCNTCNDLEELPLVYPSREENKYLVVCLKCKNVELVDKKELEAKK